MFELAWLPSYHVRRHRLARGVKLRAEPRRGLIVTIPQRFNLKDLPAILNENKSWIEKHLLSCDSALNDTLPASITFHAVNMVWHISYEKSDTPLRCRIRGDNHLAVIGDVDDKVRCRKVLLAWVKRLSKEYLIKRFDEVSQSIGVPYRDLTIRGQKTVWGSCTSQHSINLNYKLFFLPQALVNYVMIHELCHTRHLNHSMRFWKLVEIFDPHWKSHRKLLRNGDTYIPSWLFQ